MKRAFLVLLAAAALLSACAAVTETRARWLLPAGQPAPAFRHFYVVALAPTEESARKVEAGLVAELEAAGQKAVSARTLLPATAWTDGKLRESIVANVKTTPADAVLVASFVRKEAQDHYLPPAMGGKVLPQDKYFGNYDGYIREEYEAVSQPGYYAVDQHFYLQTSLYQVRDEKLVWRARSSTINPASLDAAVASYAKAMRKELAHSGALAK